MGYKEEYKKMSDEELSYALKFLSANAGEYSMTPQTQKIFDSFWDEWKRRQEAKHNDYLISPADVSILKMVKSGKMSLRDAAIKFYEMGWTNFIDVDETKRILRKAEQK